MSSRIVEETDFMRRLAVLASLALTATANAQIGRTPGAAPAAAPPVLVTDIALLYTRAEDASSPTVEAWDASGPTVGETLGARVDYFTVVPAPIVLTAGRRLELGRLVIETHGLNGNPVWQAPLKLTLEAPEGLVDLALARDEQQLLALEPGVGRLWIESLLPRGTGTGERYRLPVVIIVR